LTTPYKTAAPILSRARAFARDWAEKFLDPVLPIVPLGTSASSCFEFTRAQGGLSSKIFELRSELDGDMGFRWISRGLRQVHPELSSDLEAGGYDDIAVSLAALNLMWEDHRAARIPPAVAMPVPERGWKTRVVTKSQGPSVALGQFLRPWLLRGLKRDGRSSTVLSGDSRKAVERAFGGRVRSKGYKVVSSDLTAASDLLPHDLVESLVDGILDSRPLPDWARATFKALTGPMRIMYPWGEIVTTERGILMGLPLTWCLLSLTQLFWVEEAARSVTGFQIRHVRERTAICGDDLVGHWPVKAIDAYHTAALACGAKFSAGKHFVSDRALVFTEDCAWLVHARQREPRNPEPRTLLMSDFLPPSWRGPSPRVSSRWVVGIRWSESIPLRGLVRPTRLPGDKQIVPYWAAIGPASEAISGGSLSRFRRVRRVVACLHPTLWSWGRKHGFFVDVPRRFGGLGLPRRKGNPSKVGRQPLLVRKALATYLYGQAASDYDEPSAAWNLLKSGYWPLAQANVEARFLGLYHGSDRPHTLVRRGRVPFHGKGVNLGPVWEAFRERTLVATRQLELWCGPVALPAAVFSPFDISREVKKSFRRRADMWRSSRGVHMGTPWQKLDKRREAIAESCYWWAHPKTSRDGLCMKSVPKSVNRDIAVATGWSKQARSTPRVPS